LTVRQLITRTVLVVIVALLVGAIAYALSVRQVKQYASTTQLLFGAPTSELQVLGVPSANQDQTVALASDVLDVGSFDVARQTALALHDPRFNADTVAAAISAANERGSDVVTITARAGSPQDSAKLASTYVSQYLAIDQQRTSARARGARQVLDTDLASLSTTVRNGVRGDALRNQIGQLRIFERTGNLPQVIQSVRTGASPVAPQTFRNVLFGVLFGAILGIGLLAARGAVSPARPRRDELAEPMEIQERTRLREPVP